MKESNSTNLCAHKDDLVTYLYGEASRIEAQGFEEHLRLCASCRTEIATFGTIREAVGEWRQQALGTLAAPAYEVDATTALAPAVDSARRRSALAALREFFTLSPAWMRAATAVVAVVFCSLVAIAVAYFGRKPQTVVVNQPVNSGYTQQEMEAKIAAAIKEHDESQIKERVVSTPEDVAPAGMQQRNPQPSIIKRNTSDRAQMVNISRKQLRAQRTRARPSVEPASTDYLPFTASIDDDDLPALTDLVDDAN
jgi:hypothetical protein